MSKRSRRRLARDGDKTRTLSQPTSANPSNSASPPSSSLSPTSPPVKSNFLRSRRLPKLIFIALLVGTAGFLIYKLENAPKPGTIEYTSDDPNAQVILQKKDGEEIPLKQGSKYSMTLEPGYYTTHLATPAKDLKLRPSFINLDPNGRAFVQVKREPNEPVGTPTK